MTYQKVPAAPADSVDGDAPLGANVLEPGPVPTATRIAIVVSRFNQPITQRLLIAAVETLHAGGVEADAVDVTWVPGSFELPLAADRLAGTGRYAGVICLGAIIKGETTHDRHIAAAVAIGIEQTARHHKIPVTFGVLTCETPEQAAARAGGAQGNKGVEAAEATLAMVRLLPVIAPASTSGVS